MPETGDHYRIAVYTAVCQNSAERAKQLADIVALEVKFLTKIIEYSFIVHIFTNIILNLEFLIIFALKFIMKLLHLIIALSALLLPFSAEAQLLYKVEGKDLSSPSYIFGTHHLAPVSFLDSVSGLKSALENVEAVVGEIDMTGSSVAMAMQMQPYMTAPEDSILSKVYSPQRFEQLNMMFEKGDIMPGVNLYALERLKPMAVINLVSISIFRKSMPDYDPSAQIDAILQKYAVDSGKRVIALETPARQAELLFDFQPISVQAESLALLLENPEEAADNARELNKAYLSHDIMKLKDLSFKDPEGDDPFMEALVDRRNRDWAERLDTIFRERPVLVACGALHLPGENGLLNLLRHKGYTITAIDKAPDTEIIF